MNIFSQTETVIIFIVYFYPITYIFNVFKWKQTLMFSQQSFSVAQMLIMYNLMMIELHLQLASPRGLLHQILECHSRNFDNFRFKMDFSKTFDSGII